MGQVGVSDIRIGNARVLASIVANIWNGMASQTSSNWPPVFPTHVFDIPDYPAPLRPLGGKLAFWRSGVVF